MSTMIDNSTITLYRREKLVQITSGVISTLPPVAFMAFGNGGTNSEGMPIAPLDTETALKNEIARYPVVPVEFPISTTARYAATIPPSDLQDEVINEAALVDAEGNLCNIQAMYDKRKESGVSFTFVFHDEF